MGIRAALAFACFVFYACRSAFGSSANSDGTQFVPPGPQIDLGYVTLVGNATTPAGEVNGTVHFFGNVPYAQAPLGPLRFKAPQQLDENPPDNPSQVPVLDARSWGPPCIQQGPATIGVGSEDCLFVNVWKPSTAKEGDKLPVMVYIYGGGFTQGTTQGFPLYDWVAQSQEIIGVSLGYRLNIFGFLTSPEMNVTDLNAGVLDQRAALEWVQRHISKFGGDPDTVTIDGESAGGASTVMQVVAYGGEKPVPFKRAISESIGWGPMPTKEQSAVALQSAAAIAGCPLSGTETLDCLRQASLGSLISALNQISPGQFSPIVSGPGTILPDSPSALIRDGRFSLVDYAGGHCTNDGRTFTDGTPSTLLTQEQLIAAVLARWPSLTNETIDKMLELYPAPGTPGSPFDSEYDRTWVIEQDAVFGCMDWFLANRTAELGNTATFNFRFNAPNPVLYAQTPYEGVMHTSDLFFLFDGTTSAPNAGYTFTAFNSTEAPLSREIIAYWTSFGRSGNPSDFKESFSPVWPGQRTGQRVVMTRSTIPNSGTASSVESVSAYEVERCLFWMSANVTSQTKL